MEILVGTGSLPSVIDKENHFLPTGLNQRVEEIYP